MGNYFNYEMEEKPNIKIQKDLCLESPNDVEHLLNGYTYSKRWDMLADMARLSLAYPEETFEIIVTDEDSEDIRKIVIQNGKALKLKAEIVFPDFSTKDLEDISTKTEWNLNKLDYLKMETL